MKTATQPLIDFLATGGPFLIADLYTFTLVGGFVVRYTGADIDLTVGGYPFSSNGPLFERSRSQQTIGMEVQTMDMTVVADSTHLLNGTPWLQAVRQGGLDGAYVKVERLVTDDWASTSRGAYWVFGGRVAEITRVGRMLADFTVKSRIEELNKTFPPEQFQPACRHVLYDQRPMRCGVNRESFRADSTVGAGSTRSVINCGLANASGWFALGDMTFLAGPNAGITRTIKSYTPGVIELALPLLANPTIGDPFKAYPGCDHLQGTCSGKFNNLANYGGQPFIPVPETVL